MTAGHGLRILVIGSNYAPELTGIGPYTTGFADHLAAAGHAVTVVTTHPHYPGWRLSRADSSPPGSNPAIDRRPCHVPRHQSAFARITYEASFFASALPSILRGSRPDIVVGIVPMLADGVLARIAARRYGLPYGILVQDLMGAAARQSGIAGGTRVARAASIVEGWIGRGAARVAVVSEAFVPSLESAGIEPSRLVLVPNWVRVCVSSADRAETRRELGWRQDEIVVLHAGNMGLKQNLEQVLATARRALDTVRPLRFVLAGDGSQRLQLEREGAALPNVTFLGIQPPERHALMLRAADVLLLSERRSAVDMSLPSKLASYLASERPIVAAVPLLGASAREVLASGGGRVVEPDNPDLLLAAIDDVSRDHSIGAQMGAAGSRYAVKRFGQDRSFAAIDEFVAGIAGEFNRTAARAA